METEKSFPSAPPPPAPETVGLPGTSTAPTSVPAGLTARPRCGGTTISCPAQPPPACARQRGQAPRTPPCAALPDLRHPARPPRTQSRRGAGDRGAHASPVENHHHSILLLLLLPAALPHRGRTPASQHRPATEEQTATHRVWGGRRGKKKKNHIFFPLLPPRSRAGHALSPPRWGPGGAELGFPLPACRDQGPAPKQRVKAAQRELCRRSRLPNRGRGLPQRLSPRLCPFSSHLPSPH